MCGLGGSSGLHSPPGAQPCAAAPAQSFEANSAHVRCQGSYWWMRDIHTVCKSRLEAQTRTDPLKRAGKQTACTLCPNLSQCQACALLLWMMLLNVSPRWPMTSESKFLRNLGIEGIAWVPGQNRRALWGPAAAVCPDASCPNDSHFIGSPAGPSRAKSSATLAAATFDVMRRATCDVRRATCDVRRATCDVRRESGVEALRRGPSEPPSRGTPRRQRKSPARAPRDRRAARRHPPCSPHVTHVTHVTHLTHVHNICMATWTGRPLALIALRALAQSRNRAILLPSPQTL